MNVSRALNLAGAAVACSLMTVMAFLTWALVYREVPAANREALTVLIGILSANVSLVVGFYFGSSVSNKAKDHTVANLSEALRPQSPDAIVIPPGGQATTTATAAGTVVERTDAHP